MHPGNRLPAGGCQLKRIYDILGHCGDGCPGIQQRPKRFARNLLIGLKLWPGYPNRQERLSIDDVSAKGRHTDSPVERREFGVRGSGAKRGR